MTHYAPSPQNQQEHYPCALAFTRHWEGGFVEDPRDRGGATNLGITQKTYNYWLENFTDRSEFQHRSVKDLTPEEAARIYFCQYWVPSGADRMPWPLCLVQFDTSVQFGVGGAVQFVQEALSIPEDGIWGPQTQGAYDMACKDCLARLIIFARRRYRCAYVLEDSSQQVFLPGWQNRDNALLKVVRRDQTGRKL